MRMRSLFGLAVVPVVMCLAPGTAAAPRTPATDAEVLERLPTRPNDAAASELRTLRAAWRRDPQDAETAAALARRLVERAFADGDPRHVGHAQAVLKPWWPPADAPPPIRVQRALVLQYGHRFDEALADLQAAAQAQPGDAEAWAWMAAIRFVRADVEGARRACDALAPLAGELIGTACRAQADALSGRSEAAAHALRSALGADREAAPPQRLWALTRLGEIEQWRGEPAAAERAFRDALALGLPDVYLRAAMADLLLEQRRPAEVLALLKDDTRADVLLLRLAIAARTAGDPRAAQWTRQLAQRFDASRARGDALHRKEEARFELELQDDPARALVLARDNYAEQRECADARVLLQAAIAARQPQAAEPVLRWLAERHIDHPGLIALARRIEAQR